MTKKLLSTQRHFANHLNLKSKQEILSEIPYSKTEAIARLNVYRNNVYGGFESVLLSTFPVVIDILGSKKFASLFKKYCDKFPSKSGDLNQFGKDFPKLLAYEKPIYLKDLAQLELLHHQAYFLVKPDREFAVKKLQKLPKEKFSELVFFLDKSCFLFSSEFAVFSIWKKNSKIKNFQKDQYILIKADDIFLLTKEEFRFLQLVKKEKTLFAIYEKLNKEFKKSVDIGALLQKFISDGTIIDYA